MNSKNALITGLACVVAAVLFFITMLAPNSQKRDPQGGGSELIALSPFDNALIKGLDIHFTDDHGIRYDLLGDSLTPKSQGVIEVTRPISRIHLKPNRSVLQIEADQGTFVTPTPKSRSGMVGSVGQPQSGFLKGNVKIRVFENDSNQPINLSPNSVHEILTMTMQQATFDRDLGQIEAVGLVQIKGRDVDFEGENLTIIYSPLHQRINRLEIQKGKYIRIKQTAKLGGNENDKQIQTDKPVNQTLTPADTNTQKPPVKAAQFYHITLNDQVSIESQKNILIGDKLQLYVGFAPQNSRKSEEDQSDTSATPSEVFQNPSVNTTQATAPKKTNSENDVIIKWNGPLLMLPVEEKPKMLANAHDAYLQLTGAPMQITPPSKDIITASSIDYLLSESRVRVRGNETYPLLIDSPQLGGIITADEYEMYLDKGLGLLKGQGELRSLNRPVVASTQPTQKKSKALPPGTSVTWNDRVELLFYTEDGKHNSTDFDAIKTITFRGKVDVQHDLFDVQADLLSLHMTQPTKNKHKQEAKFINASGTVTLRTHSPDPEKQLALHAENASIQFKADNQGKMQPTQLLANDQVILRRPQQVLWADKLTVDLQTGAPESVVVATTLVDEQIAESSTVDALDTILAWEEEQTPAPTVTDATAPSTQPTAQPAEINNDDKSLLDDNKIHVKLVTVEGDVRARMINKGKPVFAFAHRITGDMNQVELFGNEDRPTQVVQDEGILAGMHLVLTPEDQNLHAIGPGSLSYLSHPFDEDQKEKHKKDSASKTIDSSIESVTSNAINVDKDNNTTDIKNKENKLQLATNKPTSESVKDDTKRELDQAAPQLPSLDPARVRVNWQDNMHYNHQNRQAQFIGHVVLTAERTNAQTSVKGDEITLLFSKFITAPKSLLDDESSLPKINPDGLVSTKSLSGGRQVRMVNIKGHAEFLEESWAPKQADQDKALLTRMRLAGENMIFDAVPETITIPGPGTLLHEDHRPSTKSASSQASNIQFTGQGQTLFRWKDQFLLDIAHNDMIMKNYVQMLHIPANSNNGIQMDCRTFLADMEATGGLGTWLSGDAPTPDLKVVQASHDVRITAQNRQITTDRATYIHNVRKVKLQADENKLTRITTPAGTSSPGAELIVWELDTNRFYIARPGRMNKMAPRRR